MRRLVFAALILGMALGGCQPTFPPGAPSPADYFDLGPLDDFALTEAQGRTVTNKDLVGRFWVASFIFTRCSGECPRVSGTMARLQKRLGPRDDVRLVSISVDPEHDTPEVLKEYAENLGADPKRWYFLTGDKEKVHHLVRDGFHLGVESNPRAPAGQEVTHSSRLVLVDKRGRVRGHFEGEMVDPEGKPIDDVPRIVARLEELRREQP